MSQETGSVKLEVNPPEPARQCGPCTVCCRGWLYHAKMKLSPGRACVHCTEAGCGIYEERPEDPCRKFRCGWLVHSNEFPEEMRPNDSGAIVIRESSWNDWTVIRAVAVGTTIPEETMKWLMSYASSRKTPIIFTEHDMEDGKLIRRRQKGYGPPDFVRAVRSSITSDDLFF